MGVDEVGSSGGILGRSFAGRSKLELISDSQGRTGLLAFFDLNAWRYQLSRSATPRITRKDRQAFSDVPLARSQSNLPACVRESEVDSVVEWLIEVCNDRRGLGDWLRGRNESGFVEVVGRYQHQR